MWLTLLPGYAAGLGWLEGDRGQIDDRAYCSGGLVLRRCGGGEFDGARLAGCVALLGGFAWLAQIDNRVGGDDGVGGGEGGAVVGLRAFVLFGEDF
jgi:hypothetical protein